MPYTDMMEPNIPIALIGISHKTAPLGIREQAAFDSSEQAGLLKVLVRDFNLDGCMIISTCNRSELYFSCEHHAEIIHKLRCYLDDHKKAVLFSDERYAYTATGEDAIRHFFQVISSLDSQIIGEPQITGQVKDAYKLAFESKTTDILINKMMNMGIHVQKKIRSDTFLTDGAVSISYAGVELAKKIFTKLSEKQVLLIGAGDTALLAATHFVENGIRKISFVNRTVDKARELAARFGGDVYSMDQLDSAFENVDIVISATSSSEYILEADFISEVIKQRHHEPLFLIDLAVPRDIDPLIDKINGVYLYNIDDLNEVIQMNIEKRNQEVPKAFKLVDRYVVEFDKWVSTHSLSSTITRLKSYFDQIRTKELNRLKKRLPKEEFSEIDYLTQSIMNKLMHQHIKTLKSDTADPVLQQQQLDLLHRMYELDRES